MHKRRIRLDDVVVTSLFNHYRHAGYPLGKNRRGRKKWITRYVHRVLREFIKQEKLDKTA